MKNPFKKWFLLSVVVIVLTEISNKLLNIQGLYYNSLAEQLTHKQIENVLALQAKWQWLGYVLIPIMLLLKTTLIASVLYIGTYFYSKVAVTFRQLWGLVLGAEFVFLIVPVVKLVWFYWFETTYTLQDLQYFMPLSALTIVGYKGLEAWFVYPLQLLNLFEVAYVGVLAYQIGKATQTNMDNGLKIVLSSYAPALLLWVVMIMFVTLNMS